VKINQKRTHRVQPTFISLLALTFDVNLIPHKVIPAAEYTKLANLHSFLKVIMHIHKMQYRDQPTFISLLALTFDVNLIPHKVIPAAEYTKLSDLQSFLEVICIYIKCRRVKQKKD